MDTFLRCSMFDSSFETIIGAKHFVQNFGRNGCKTISHNWVKNSQFLLKQKHDENGFKLI